MALTNEQIYRYILDSIPYHITFIDTDYVIRFMNKYSRYFNHEVLGYPELVGTSLLDLHSAKSNEMTKAAMEMFKNHIPEIFMKVSGSNERIYMNPVRDENGELVGLFERFERNLYLDPDANSAFKLSGRMPPPIPTKTWNK